MNMQKMRMVASILKALTPVLFEIVDDIMDAREGDSDGGEGITKAERQQIIMDNVLDIPEQIMQVLKDL